MADLKELKKSLETNPAARAKFLANLLDTLEKSGLDVNDKKVIDSLKLNLDLSDGKEFVKGLAASTVIITIVM
jgi:hypothetical protein